MSGRVQVIAYIRHLITRAYSNLDTDMPMLGYNPMFESKSVDTYYNHNN